MTKRRFANYRSLTISLGRASVKNQGTVANLLLETFVINQGEIRAGAIVERKLCKEGEFTKWRDELIKKGWLCYNIGDYSRHTAGPKLVKYINKEKMARSSISTTDDLWKTESKLREDLATRLELNAVNDKLGSELAEVKNEVKALRDVVTQMIEEFDPPVTEEKVQRRLKIVREK